MKEYIEIPEPELTRVIGEMERKGIDPYQKIEFVGETAVWLDGNKAGSRERLFKEENPNGGNTDMPSV